MLPEGVFRTQLAQERSCREDDHFALFAACGLIVQGGHYLARKRHGVTRIIGKLPQADRPMLPEVEHLSLSLAQAAGANVCEHKLVSLKKLDFEHGYTLGGSGNFLAVTRFDRAGAQRIHCEDFAQALSVDPRHKYTGATYAAMAGLMLRYPDGHTPVLSKAFDIVAWSAYITSQGQHKASKTLSPAALREFCNRVGVAEQPCAKIIKETVARAKALWPDMISSSPLLDVQKERLLRRLAT